MPKYVIERELPGAGKLTDTNLRNILEKSRGVVSDAQGSVVWQQSYVTDDKIYCVYIAPDENAVRKHAEAGGFPANKITKVSRVIDPATAE